MKKFYPFPALWRCMPIVGLMCALALDAQAVEVKANRSCKVWAADKGVVTSLNHEAWLMGFMSGLATATDRDVLKGTDAAWIFVRVDSFCMVNPLKHIGDAGVAVFEELLKKKGF